MTGILHQLGLKYGTDKATFHGYCDFYQEHLPVSIDALIEIGIMDGASLQMWSEFYPTAEIIGLDIVPERCRNYGPMIATYCSDATQPGGFARIVNAESIDVIVDDGSHMTRDQQDSFSLFWPKVRPGGFYIIEDLHTSFQKSYVNTPLSTVEWLEQSDHLRVLDVEWFHRDHPDGSRSDTAVIKKPEE